MNKTEPLSMHLRNLFSTQRLAVLATHSNGQPFTNLVAFTATEDLKFLLFATPRETRKYANILADPRVALMVDNRENRTADFQEATAVGAMGLAKETSRDEIDDLRALYILKHPHLKSFVMAPGCSLLKVEVEKYDIVRRFQEVEELQMKP